MTPALPISHNTLNAFMWKNQGFDRILSWDVSSALGAPLGHYATGATLYPSLLGRYDPLTFAAVAYALDEQRALLRMRAMRGTLFAVPRRLIPVAFQATQRQNLAGFNNTLKWYSISLADYDAFKARILAALAEREMTIAELKKAVSPLTPEVERGFGAIRSMLSAEGRIVRARVKSGWRSDTCTYTLFEHWLPDISRDAVSPVEAQLALALAYFDIFGPATDDDFKWWSGPTRAEVAPALAAARPHLTALRIEGLDGDHWLPESALDSLREQRAPATGARLLPMWDAYVMAYRRRERYLAPQWSDRIYDAVGNATSALLVEGELAGVWEWDDGGKRHVVKVAPFAPRTEAQWRDIGTEAHRLMSAVHAGKPYTLEVQHCSPPQSLLRGGQNLFKSPLQNATGTPI